jgi:hypothetical protein
MDEVKINMNKIAHDNSSLDVQAKEKQNIQLKIGMSHPLLQSQNSIRQ